MVEALPINACYLSPLGPLGICVRHGALRAIRYLGQARIDQPDSDASTFARLLAAYFQDPHHVSVAGFQPRGTSFQRRVWDALVEIPAGQVCTYGELATRLGTGARAVGNACRANPIPILIPCHRVVAAAGPGGYMGADTGNLERKEWLLAHEQ